MKHSYKLNLTKLTTTTTTAITTTVHTINKMFRKNVDRVFRKALWMDMGQ